MIRVRTEESVRIPEEAHLYLEESDTGGVPELYAYMPHNHTTYVLMAFTERGVVLYGGMSQDYIPMPLKDGALLIRGREGEL